jgi:hypothetical protein
LDSIGSNKINKLYFTREGLIYDAFSAKTAIHTTNVITEPFYICNMTGKAGIMKLGMSWIS